MAMTELKADVDPAEVGFDPARLDRIDRHFRRYVDDGRLPGWLITVSRQGRLAHVSGYGSRDMQAGLPVETDTLWRIYSMTKPITSVAAMILYEEGAFELTDPVSAFIPSFADVRVYAGGSDLRPLTVPATEPVRIWHLLTHTAGLTYGFHRVHAVDARYRDAGFEWGTAHGMDLAQCCDAWAEQPLLFQPGRVEPHLGRVRVRLELGHRHAPILQPPGTGRPAWSGAPRRARRWLRSYLRSGSAPCYACSMTSSAPCWWHGPLPVPFSWAAMSNGTTVATSSRPCLQPAVQLAASLAICAAWLLARAVSSLQCCISLRASRSMRVISARSLEWCALARTIVNPQAATAAVIINAAIVRPFTGTPGSVLPPASRVPRGQSRS